jgi:hypothetical protein
VITTISVNSWNLAPQLARGSRKSLARIGGAEFVTVSGVRAYRDPQLDELIGEERDNGVGQVA